MILYGGLKRASVKQKKNVPKIARTCIWLVLGRTALSQISKNGIYLEKRTRSGR